MRVSLGMVVLAVALSAARAGAQIDADSPAARFERANAAYEAGDYAAAIDDYTRVVEAGVVTPELYYNLGNAYFKDGGLGRAVLWYERARRLSPRDPDVRDNLDLTRSLLRDKQLVATEPRWRRALFAWHRDTTAGESVAAASALYVVLCLLGILFVFRESDAISRLYARLSILSPGRLLGLDKAQDLGLAMGLVLLVCGAFATSAVSKIRAEQARSQGVVVAEEVSVFSGPSRDASVQFKVHEGTLVSVRDARPGWVRVDLPGDLSGWVDETTLDRI
ncbi:MAG TPA: tetratricopeptide repeat protein [Candidatus Krumholzibacteria bacterium]|nr:tetratricopeptide repeat protein [Candidatus Krumholzibacteria bacterium]